MLSYRAILGLFIFTLIAWLLSNNRSKVNFRLVLGGFFLQFLVALMIFKTPLIKDFFHSLSYVVQWLQKATSDGAQFVFGYLGGGPQPFQLIDKPPFILAINGLTMLIVMSALTTLLFYWRILPVVINFFGFLFQKTLGLGGALGLGSAANIFFGMDAAPLCIRPYLKDMTKTELFAFMSVGMATVAGTVMVVYATVLGNIVEGVIGHIITASLISIPAAITFARIIVPETGTATAGELKGSMNARNSMEAITKGTIDGVQVFINVVAMLMVLVALISLANQILSFIPSPFNEPISLQGLLGYVFSPIVWLIGIPWEQANTAGALMGTKTILNELIAYIDLANLSDDALDNKSRLILIYALCGFANLGSVGIMIGSLGTLVPERRHDVVELGLKTILSGTLATLSTGAVVSFFV